MRVVDDFDFCEKCRESLLKSSDAVVRLILLKGEHWARMGW